MTFWCVSNKLVGEGRVIVWSNLLTNQRYGIVNGLHIVVHCCIFFSLHSNTKRHRQVFFFLTDPIGIQQIILLIKKTRKEKLIKKTSIIKKIYRFIEKPNHHQQQLLLCNYNILFSLIP